jgi:hypothetical protein
LQAQASGLRLPGSTLKDKAFLVANLRQKAAQQRRTPKRSRDLTLHLFCVRPARQWFERGRRKQFGDNVRSDKKAAPKFSLRSRCKNSAGIIVDPAVAFLSQAFCLHALAD